MLALRAKALRPYRRSSSFSAKKDGPAGGLRPSHFTSAGKNSFDPKAKESEIVPPLAPDSIRIIPLGGVEEIGKNCTMIEVGDDIIVIDIGFQFKDENTPGIDYILPNTKYVEERKDKVRAVIITHGHLDHIGAIPFVMPRIGNPPALHSPFDLCHDKETPGRIPSYAAT